MSDRLEEYKERVAQLQQNGELTSDAQTLLEEMLADLVEMNRSNKALRRVILKNGQASSLSTRLRDALYE